jgi:uncharacterized membrane protein (DUF4010 family)
MAVTVGVFAAFYYFRDGSTEKRASAKGEVDVKNPFSLMAAAKFGVLFAVILLAVKIVQQTMPPSGLYAVALSGLVDVDAITLSMAEFAQSGEARVAVIAIVIASLSNTLVKCGMACAVAGLTLGKPLLIATAATLFAGLAAAFLV